MTIRIISLLAACALSISVGWWLASGHYQPRLDDATVAITQCQSARDNLLALIDEQGAALGRLVTEEAQRQARAAAMLAEARVESEKHYQAAQRIVIERTGGDQCTAAESVIDHELGL